MHKRNKSKIVEISISKREDALSGGESGSAPKSEQELHMLISSTISATLEAAAQQPPGAAAAVAGDGSSKQAALSEDVNGAASEPMDAAAQSSQGEGSDGARAREVSEELCERLEKDEAALEPWHAYLQVSAKELRESLLEWHRALENPGKEVELERKEAAMAELAGAFRTLDASLAVYPLLQWLHTRGKRASGAAEVEEARGDGILLRACGQLELGKVIDGADADADAGEGREEDLAGGSSSNCAGAGEEGLAGAVCACLDDMVSVPETCDRLRQLFLSKPLGLWCAMLSDSLEKVVASESAKAAPSYAKLEMLVELGWSLVGREFSVELLSRFVNRRHASGAAETGEERLLGMFLVKLQGKECRRDALAQRILQPIERYVTRGNPPALGSMLEVRAALDYELRHSGGGGGGGTSQNGVGRGFGLGGGAHLGSAEEAGAEEARLGDAFAAKVRAWDPAAARVDEGSGHWGVRTSALNMVCPVCGLDASEGDQPVVVFLTQEQQGGQVYHQHCCPEDAPSHAMPAI